MSKPEASKPLLSGELLQAIAAQHGVEVQEADLEPVIAFLRVLLPELEKLEQIVSPDTVPAGLFLPAEEP